MDEPERLCHLINSNTGALCDCICLFFSCSGHREAVSGSSAAQVRIKAKQHLVTFGHVSVCLRE